MSGGSIGRVRAAEATAGGWLRRIAAFTDDPAGGNPAGVWVGDALPDEATMQRIAAEVGYSETAFAAPASGSDRVVRYYSPLAEVPFCGHATIALGRVLGDTDGPGRFALATAAGPVALDVQVADGRTTATLTSVEPAQHEATAELVDRVLALLGWDAADLDRDLPPAVAVAGARHLVLATRSHDRLAGLSYPFEELREVMAAHDLTTVALVHRAAPTVVHARNPFPVGGVVEDPATGAAAAALGGLLRARGLVEPPADVVVHQGHEMGRPSRLDVHIPVSGGIEVSGTAVDLPPPD